MVDVQRTRIKLCGITRQVDADAASSVGIDALGFNFFEESPRFVAPSAASDIITRLSPFVTTVGLFVNAGAEFVRDTLRICRLDLLQFHGDETEGYCRQFNVPYLKALRHRDEAQTLADAAGFPSASGILLDAYKPGLYGGTGQSFDWGQVPNFDQPLILAGGLTAENVGQAIASAQPYSVDVSGGVESAPGIKDERKIAAFVSAVKQADQAR